MGDPDATYESSLANSLRALELDPELAEAHAVRGLVLYADGRYVEATPEFERALRLGPDLFETHFFYARNCRLQGRHQQAAALFERAATLRLNDFRSLGLLAESYKALGRRADLMTGARQCLERVEAEIEVHPDNAGALAFGSAVLAELGQGARAKEWAARSNMIAPDDYLGHYNVARTHAILGERDAALDWLERLQRVRHVATSPGAVDEERWGHRSPARPSEVPRPLAAARGNPRIVSAAPGRGARGGALVPSSGLTSA